MREISVQLYHFSELSDEAKEKAREYVRTNWDLYDISGEENASSFEGLAKLFGGKIDYEYSAFYCRRNYAKVTGLPWYADDPEESREYLLDNSGIIRKECPFSGTYLDEVILQPFRDYLDNPDDRTIEDLCREASAIWLQECINDERWHYEDEYIDDLLSANDYEFTVNGEPY